MTSTTVGIRIGAGPLQRALSLVLLIALTGALLVVNPMAAHAAYTVSGTVLDGSNSNALGGVTVEAVPLGADGAQDGDILSTTSSTVTETLGQYSFTDLAVGTTYQITAFASTGNSHWTFVDQAATADLTVRAPNISGTLQNPSGGALAGGFVDILEDGIARFFVVSDGTGAFSAYVDLTVPETVITLEGYPDYDNHEWTWWTSEPVTVATGDSAGKILQVRQSHVEGVVKNSANQNSVGGQVQAYVETETAPEHYIYDNTNADGLYGLLLELPASGTRTFTVRAWPPQTNSTDLPVDVQLTYDAAANAGAGGFSVGGVALTDGDNDRAVELPFTLVAANYSGNVYEPDADGNPNVSVPVQNARVEVKDTGDAVVAETHTDSTGEFRFALTFPATYSVVAYPPESSSLTASAPVNATGTASGVQIALGPVPVPNVIGQVVDDQSTPAVVGGADVVVLTTDWMGTGHNTTTATSGDVGSFGLTLGQGTYRIYADVISDASLAWSEYVDVEINASGLARLAGTTDTFATTVDLGALALRTANVTGTVSAGGASLPGTGYDVVSIGVFIQGRWDDQTPWAGMGKAVYAANAISGTFGLYLDPAALAGAETFQIRAEPPYGNLSYVASPWQAVDFDAPTGLSLVLGIPNLSGTVTDGTDPVPAAEVVVSLDGEQVSSTNSLWDWDDQNDQAGTNHGKYVLGLPPATAEEVTRTYEVEARISGRADLVRSITHEVVVNTDGDVTGVTGGDATATPAALNLALRAPNVIGTVRDPNGVAYGGANVEMAVGNQWFDPARSSEDQGTTGQYGALLDPIGGANTVYELQASVFGDSSVAPSAVLQIHVRGTDGHVSLDGVNFTATLSNVNLALRTPNVTGVVRDPDGSPVVDAGVQIRTHNYNYNDWANTDESGEFGFYVEDAGNYVVSADPPWGSSSPWGRSANVDVVVKIVDSAPVVTSPPLPIEVRLQQANVTGIVTYPNGNAVGDAGIQIRSSDPSVDYWDWTNSDQNGAFRLALPPGEYLFTAEPPWNSTQYGRSVETTVTVTASGFTPNPLTLALTNPNVTGSVVNSAGDALSTGTWVEIRSADYSFFTHANTSQTGTFVLTLQDGTYFVRANPPWEGADSDEAASREIEIVVAGGTLTQVDGEAYDATTNPLKLSLSQPAVKGTACVPAAEATDCTGGQAIGWGWAVLHDQNWTFQLGSPVDDQGNYSFGGLTAGTYYLDVFAPWDRSDLQPVTNLEVVVPADTSQWPVTVNALYPVANETIKVEIYQPGADGALITSDDFWVHAFNRNGGFSEDRNGPAGGVYELPVTDGSWEVMIQAKNPSNPYIYTGHPKFVSVEPNGTPTVIFKTVSAGGLIQGSIVNPDDSALVRHTQNSAWVDARSTDGRGNGGELIACPDGADRIPGSDETKTNCFQIRVPAGTYQLYVHPFNGNYGAPATQTIKVAENGTVTVDGDAVTDDIQSLKLTSRNAQIQGRVAYASGTAVSGVEVFAWQPGGGGFAHTFTASDGSYTLKVSPGDWEVGIWPGPDDTWVYDNPPLRMKVASGQTVTGKNFTVTASAATIEGRLTLPGVSTTAKVDAFVWLQNVNTDAGNGAPVINGTFTVPVPAGDYELRVFLAPGSVYAAPAPVQLSVTTNGAITPPSGMTMPLNLSLRASDSTLSGVLVDQDGNPVTADLGESVIVFATGATGEYVETLVNYTGTQNEYTLNLSSGVWNLGFYILPEIPYARLGVDGTRDVDLTSVATATRDLRIVAANQTLSGTVVDSDGAVPFAWVFAEATETSAYPSVRRGVTAAGDGTFSINVPAGEYRVGAAAEVDGHQRPATITVTAPQANLSLAFRVLDSTISGTVTSGGVGVAARVEAWSAGGGFASTTAAANGTYSLAVSGGDIWHVEAIDTGGGTVTTVLVSDEQVVDLAVGASASGIDLALASVTVPSALTRQFDASQAQVITIGGVTLTIPAGALDTSGQVSINASPNAKPGTTADTKPIGIGYAFEAFDLTDANGNSQQVEITGNFNKAITISFGYDPAQLTQLGLVPTDLLPVYWDQSTGSYRKIENATVNESNSTVTFTVDHFTDFAVASSGSPAPTVTSVSPSSTTQGGAAAVTITGTGFLSGATVKVGGTAASGVAVASATSITATVPGTLGAGSHDVVVTNTDGKAGTKAGGFTVNAVTGGGGGGGGTAAPAPSAPRTVSDELPAGGSVTTDTSGAGATAEQPIQTAITSPVAGTVSIVESEDTGTSPGGFQLVGRSLDITAPDSTADQPLVIALTVDATLVTDDVPLAVFRNGALVPRCATEGTTTASPDPCVTTRTTAGDDLVITVLTSKASVWTLGVLDTTSELAVACPESTTPTGGFSDVPSGFVHERGIDCVADWGIARGTGDGFAPAKGVTRGQMATFIAGLLEASGVELPAASTSAFADVDGHTHETAIAQLHQLGIVGGTSPTTFHPNRVVTRGQMASFLVAAFEHVTGTEMNGGGMSFTDVASGATHAESIGKVSEIGFAKGTSATTYAPADPVVRSQMATFLARMLDRLAAEGYAYR